MNYCFFKPEVDGSITETDTWADENLLLGEMDWSSGTRDITTSIIYNAHLNNVQILPSIGGWTLSDNFPSIAADPIKRSNFAQSCVSLIQQYGFDGIDLDWEYPGYIPHNGTAQDISNFTLLLQEIRTAIDIYGQSVNKTMLLTIAVGAAPDKMDDVEWAQVSNIVDIINLMSYDFFGAFDSQTNHNAPLYSPTSGNPEFNIHNSVERLINTYNVSPQKITVGVAFYGRSAKTNSNPGLHVNSTGAQDLSTFGIDAGTPMYYNVLNNINLFSEQWDSTAQVPYLLGNGSLNTFVSYDDQQSIGLKAQYIVDNNLRGAIIWEITGDYIESSAGSGVIIGTPLADTLNNVFCNYTGPININVTITSEDTICEGETTTLSANGADTYLWSTGETTPNISVSPSHTSTYSVTGTQGAFNDNISHTIIVVPLPSTPIIFENANSELQTMQQYNTYQWYIDSAQIMDSINQYIYPILEGNYQIEVTNNYGCIATSDTYYWSADAPTMISENNIRFKVYPNPSQGRITIFNGSENNFHIKLISIEGKVVQDFGRQEGTFVRMDAIDLPSGIYYFMIRFDNNKIKIIPITFE